MRQHDHAQVEQVAGAHPADAGAHAFAGVAVAAWLRPVGLGGYFDAVEAHAGSNLAVTDDCNRIENGVQTTNNPAIGLTLGCKEGLKHLTYITKVRNRRYPVVDVERQLVWGLVVFDVPPGGTITMVVNGEKIVREQAPRTIRIAELFKVTGRMISDIEVVVRNGPIGAGDGWS